MTLTSVRRDRGQEVDELADKRIVPSTLIRDE